MNHSLNNNLLNVGDRVFGRLALTACALSLLTAFPSLASAAEVHNVVENVVFSKSGSETVVRFNMHEPVVGSPKAFRSDDPSKIVVDFENSSSKVKIAKKDVIDAGLANVVLADARGKTRAVLELKSKAEFDAKIEGNAYVLTVHSPLIAGVESTKLSAQYERATSGHALTAIDFRRGANGEAKILVDLSDASSTVDIKKQGQSLVLEFLGTSIPESLRKKLNVVDFGTPVQTITSTAQGTKTRMVIEPTGPWQYLSYQVDNRLTVEVGRPKADAAAASAAGYKGEPMTVHFQNVEVRRLLTMVKDFSGLNIVASDTVQGNLTLDLDSVPWDQVFDIILKSKDLDMRKNGSVVLVAPREEIAKREKDIADNAAQLSDTEPLRNESFQLNYTSTSEMLAVLTNDKQRILSKRGSAVVDPRTNQIFVQDIPERLIEVAKMIKKIDIAMRQVQIEARIVEASDKFSQNIGARLGFNSASPYKIGGTNAVIGGGLATTGYQTGQTTDVSTFADSLAVNLPSTSTTGADAGKFSMVLFNNAATRFLNLELSALEADGKGKIISSPRVVTADQEVALIEQGVELPYQEASSSGAATISFKKANLRLEVKPHITPDGNIIMTVEINKDAPGTATSSGIAIDTKHIKAKVMIENGGTVVIGGIYTQDERTDVSKIPFLGDLPFAGALFRNKVKQDTKTELLFFLTPRILDDSVSSLK